MKRRKVDSQREQRILTALVNSRRFLAQARSIIDVSLLDVPHFRVVAEWTLTYFKEYKKAPRTHIKDFFNAWAEDNGNEELVTSVRALLRTLRKKPKTNPNVQYLLDELRDFMAKKSIQRFKEKLEYSLMRGEVKKAESLISGYKAVEVSQDDSFDPLHGGEEHWDEAFAERAEPLIVLPGAEGEFFNFALTRDALVGVQAPEKTGKTAWLIELALHALSQKKKVAFFETGDLSKSQIMLRLGIRWSGLPLWERQKGINRIPSKINIDEVEETGYSFDYKKRNIKRVISQRAVKKGRRRFYRRHGLTKDEKWFRVSVKPIGSFSVSDIIATLDKWKEQGFEPDVIVIDYADILKAEDPKVDKRIQEDDKWKALRNLSQVRHCLVLTATQSSAKAYGKKETGQLQSMEDFSESKGKYSHCTAMFGLNQTDHEKDIQGMRINWIVLREAPYIISRPLYVGQCVSLGKMMTVARF